MKNLLITIVLASAAIFIIPSCGKEGMNKSSITQTIEVQLKANEAYVFTLPKNQADDAYIFNVQAKHFLVSELGKDASGNRVYAYTPALNYSGTESVVVSSELPISSSHCGGGQSNNNNGHSNSGTNDHYVLTFNINVDKSPTEIK